MDDQKKKTYIDHTPQTTNFTPHSSRPATLVSSPFGNVWKMLKTFEKRYKNVKKRCEKVFDNVRKMLRKCFFQRSKNVALSFTLRQHQDLQHAAECFKSLQQRVLKFAKCCFCCSEIYKYITRLGSTWLIYIPIFIKVDPSKTLTILNQTYNPSELQICDD